MDHLSERNPKSGTEGGEPGRKKSWASWTVLIAILAFAAAGILSFLVLSRLNQIGREVNELSTQVQQNNQKVAAVSDKAASALDRASQAEQSAQQAQQLATEAQQKAEEYRKEREAELDRLQQALGQIATTRRTALGLVMTLGSKSIRFDFDKSTLRPEDKQVLSRIAGILSTLKGYQIYVYGYTDDIGTREYNLKLSERRAKAVYDYLVQNGLDPNIMTTKGFGEADPLVPGSSPEARAINRRVEIGIVDSTIHPYPALTQ